MGCGLGWDGLGQSFGGLGCVEEIAPMDNSVSGTEIARYWLGCKYNSLFCRHQRPVRCMLDRDEDMIMTGNRHPFATKYRVWTVHTALIVTQKFYILPPPRRFRRLYPFAVLSIN